MFGIELKTLLLGAKVIVAVAVIGLLVNKGMMLERARWLRAIDTANAKIATVNTDAEIKIAAAEAERDKAVAAANAALAVAKLNPEQCHLPADLITKANAIR